MLGGCGTGAAAAPALHRPPRGLHLGRMAYSGSNSHIKRCRLDTYTLEKGTDNVVMGR